MIRFEFNSLVKKKHRETIDGNFQYGMNNRMDNKKGGNRKEREIENKRNK
jgi:hypothetical protein